jgi:alpha-L-fucosidase 2
MKPIPRTTNNQHAVPPDRCPAVCRWYGALILKAIIVLLLGLIPTTTLVGQVAPSPLMGPGAIRSGTTNITWLPAAQSSIDITLTGTTLATGRMVELWMYLPSRAPAGAGIQIEMLGRQAPLPLGWIGWRRLIIPVSLMPTKSGAYNVANKMRLLRSGGFDASYTINYCGGTVATDFNGHCEADEDLLDSLDLTRPGLSAVSVAVQIARTTTGATRTQAINDAKAALATYFRQNFTSRLPLGTGSVGPANTIVTGYVNLMNLPYTFPFINGVPGEIDWRYNPTLQPGYTGAVNYEWNTTLQRMDNLATLAKAYNNSASTAAEKNSFAAFWSGNIRSFADQEPPPAIRDETSVSTWRGLDSGVRLCSALTGSFFVFARSSVVTDADILTYLKLALDHGNHLAARVYQQGNHYPISMSGLLTLASVFPEFSDSAYWRQVSMDNLEYSFAENTFPDGAWVELSPSYHLWVVQLFNGAAVALAQNGFGDSMPQSLWDKLKAMAEWMVKIGAPDRTQPTLNDSIPKKISDAGFTGWQDHFSSPLVAWAQQLKSETASQNFLPATTLKSLALPDSGYTVLRSGWGKTDHYTLMDVGPRGGWHGHQDALNLVTYFHGRPYLFDNGGYIYDTSVWRAYGPATASHNTVMVDGLNQARSYNTTTDPIGLNPVDTPSARFGTSDAIDYASCWYVGGYGTSGNRIATHRRELAFLKTASGGGPLLLVVDTLSPTDTTTRSYDLRWHLKSTSWQSQAGANQAGPQIWTTDRDTTAYPAVADQPNLAVVSVSGPSQFFADSAVMAAQGNDLLGWFYPSQVAPPVPALTLRHKLPATAGKVRMVTLLVPFKGTPQNPVANVVPTGGATNSWTVSFVDNRAPITITLDPAAGSLVPSFTLSSIALPALEPLAITETPYSYINTTTNTAPGTAWSAGTGWNDVPAGSASTSLYFGNGVALAAGQTIFSNNDIAGNFALNRLSVNYSGPASGTNPSVTLAGNPLQLVDNGSLSPLLLFQTAGAVKPSVTLNQNIVFTHDATLNTVTDALLGGVFSGTAGFIKEGGAFLRYQGNSPSYAGNIDIRAGTLQIGNNGNAGDLGTGTINMSGGHFTVRRNGGSLSFNNTITGAGNVTFQTNNNFVVTLNKANAYDGPTTLSPTAANTVGTLRLGINNAIPTDSVLTITNSGTSVQTFALNNFNQTLGGLATAAGGTTTNSKVTLGTGTLTLQDNDDRAFAGEISGAGNLVKQGDGTWTLAGAHTYTGTTAVSAGTLLVNGSLANSTTTVASAAALGGSGSLGGALTVNGTLAPGDNAVGNLTTGALTFAPGAVLEWQLDDWTGAAGVGYDRVTAASLTLTATSASPVTLRLVGPAPLNFSETSTSFTLVQATGALTRFNANRFLIDASALTSPQGTWAVGTSGNNLVLNYTRLNRAPTFPAGTVNLPGTEAVVFSGQLTATDSDAGDTLAYQKVSGPAWLTVSATGALGGTPAKADVGVNTFVFRATDSLGATADVSVVVTVIRSNVAPTFPAATINLNGTEAAPFSGTLLATDGDVGETLTYQKVSGPAWLTVSTLGTLSGTPANADIGANTFVVRVTDSMGALAEATLVVTVDSLKSFTYTGTTTVATPGLGWSTGTGWSAVPAGGTGTTLTFGNGAVLTAGQAIFTSNDLGTFGLNRLNMTYAGPTSGAQPNVTISTGAIQWVGYNPTLNLNATGGSTNKPNLVFAGSHHFAADTTITGPSDVRFAGPITQSLGAIITKTGAGVVRVDSNNPGFTGDFIVAGGALQVGNNGNDGDLGFATVTLAQSGTFTVRKSASLVFNTLLEGATTGAVNFQLRNGAILTLNRAATYTADTTLSPTGANVAGKLQLGLANALPATTALTVTNNGTSVQTFELNGFAQTLAALATGTGGKSTNSIVTNSGTLATLTLSGPATTTYAGALSGAINLTKSGPGSQALTGTVSYTGDTTVQAGTLALQSANASNQTASVSIAATGATLQLDFSGTDTVKSLFIGGVAQPAGVYKAPGNPGAGTALAQLAGTGTLTVTSGPPVVAYDAWSAARGLTAANSAMDLDPDGDGHVNLLEFALNGDPLNSTELKLQAALEDTDGDGRHELTLTIPVRNGSGSPIFSVTPTPTASVDGITYTIEGSVDLVFPNGAVSEISPPGDPPPLPAGWEYRRFRLDAFGDSATKGFLRVKVTVGDAAKRYALTADKPASLDLTDWEANSFPIGNGHFGVSFFGGISEELWQFTEKSLFIADPAKPPGQWDSIGLSSLCELRLIQAHDSAAATAYRRELDLEKALGSVAYALGGVTYRREVFASYPDRVFAAQLTASQPGKISFTLRAQHPYLNENRTGTVTVENKVLILRGETLPYNHRYEVRIAIRTQGGTVTASAAGPDPVGTLTVEGADVAEVYVTLGTNYRLESKTFINSNASKLEGNPLPSADIANTLAAALSSNWAALRARHEADVVPLFRRASIDLGGIAPALPTADLLASTTRSAADSRYLEELYFQFGRYLLIASSRPGTLPANLQGTWNMHPNAPWTGGYWANINIQMNYWPAFSTGLEDTFEPYHDFFQAAFARQQAIATSTLNSWNRPVVSGGWTAGTGNSPFKVDGPGVVSGAGTGPFVLLPLWDWYAYTGRTDVLEKLWPFLLASSRFLSAVLQEQPDGTLLCVPSWSPEQKNADGSHVELPGSAYDQQLVYENHRLTLRVAQLLGKTDPLLATLAAQLPKLSPVLVGEDSQIKEFRQENKYGEFGEYRHRHISQLIGLYPGTVITEKPEWLAAAKVSLTLRGDQSTGWAMAHRLNAWTRVKDGERCLVLLQTLLRKGTLPNLWDTHPPFQIDGNFGGTSGIAEMLLQSHETVSSDVQVPVIHLLPALPAAWSAGTAYGLRARGAFIVDQEWRAGRLVRAKITSQLGRPCQLRYGDERRTLALAPGASQIFTPSL